MSDDITPPVLQSAIDEFNKWSDEHVLSEQQRNTIDATLYHYTDGRGLKGILETQTIWFTDYRHMNDPSELLHGIDMAKDVARIAANGADGRVRLFLETLSDMFSPRNFSSNFEFFIASFSRDRDDLGQWRAYADNGRGYAIGFAPHIFAIEDKRDREPNENVVVGPVRYDINEVCARHEVAVERVASIFLNAVEANADLVSDQRVRFPFMQNMARAVIASPLIWNCLTTKHPAYAHEREVRLILLGLTERLATYITTRLRGSEIVPYVIHQLPVKKPHSLAGIVVGPAAPIDAERTVRTLLRSLGYSPDLPVSRSDIPYRAS